MASKTTYQYQSFLFFLKAGRILKFADIARIRQTLYHLTSTYSSGMLTLLHVLTSLSKWCRIEQCQLTCTSQTALVQWYQLCLRQVEDKQPHGDLHIRKFKQMYCYVFDVYIVKQNIWFCKNINVFVLLVYSMQSGVQVCW